MELSQLVKDHNTDAQPAVSPSLAGQDTSQGYRPGGSGSGSFINQNDRNRNIAHSRGFWGRLRAFLRHSRELICSERINVLLAFVPIGITVGFFDVNPILKFVLNALAIIPLAVLISTATENLASRLGDTFGALLNVTVGNAAELMIFFVALAKNQIRIVQASLLGSVLTNLMLILGTALVLGGVRFKDRLRDRPAVRLSIALLDLGLLVSIYPIAFWTATTQTDSAAVRHGILALSRGTSFGLIAIYILYLTIQMKMQSSIQSTELSAIAMESSEGIQMTTMRRAGSGQGSQSSDYANHSQNTVRKPNIEKLQSGMSRPRWLRWVSAQRARDQYSHVPHDTEASVLLHQIPSNEDLDSASESHTDTDDDHEQSKQIAGSDPTFSISASDTPSLSTVNEAIQASRTRSTALPPSPPSTAPSPSEHGSDAPRGRRLLSHTNEATNGHIPHSANLHWSTDQPRRPADLATLRRNTFKDLHEHRRSRSQQSQTPLAVSVTVLLISTAFASICSEFAVGSIPYIVESANISQIFLGFIVLPVVGNAAEHVTAAKLAMRDKFVLAKSVAVESSTQIVLLITPAMILLGWARNRELSLQFDIYEITAVVVASVIASLVVSCGKGDWKQGVLLWTIFGIIAVGALFYPTSSKVYGRQI